MEDLKVLTERMNIKKIFSIEAIGWVIKWMKELNQSCHNILSMFPSDIFPNEF